MAPAGGAPGVVSPGPGRTQGGDDGESRAVELLGMRVGGAGPCVLELAEVLEVELR